MLKRIRNSWLMLIFFLCFAGQGKAQCVFLQTNAVYNCLTGSPDVTVTVVGTTIAPPYTITSSPAGVYTVINTNSVALTNVPVNALGGYNLNIATTTTCTGYGSGTFFNPTATTNVVFSNTMVSCHNGSDGIAVAVFLSGATPPFTWNWSTGATTPSITGLPAGPYAVSITDSQGCTASRTFTITQPADIFSTPASTFVPCFNGTMTTSISTTGGNPPFTYTVNGVASTGSIATGIAAGTSTIITKDNKGCLKTEYLTFGQAQQQIVTPTITQPSCPGKSDGAVTVNVAGSFAGYSYTWTPGNSNSVTLSNIPSGNYTVSVSDASACITSSVITVSPAAIINPAVAITKENCSAADGSFTLSISGGYPPYTQTTIPLGITTLTASGLSTTSYTTIIIDSHNCVDSIAFWLGNHSTVDLHVFTVTPVECYNTCNGSVVLNVQNAVQPLTYSLTGLPTSTNNVISGLCAGFYMVKAVDAIGCPAFDTIYFAQPPAFSYSAATPPGICIGRPAHLNAVASGGNGALSYFWNPGGINAASVTVQPAVTTVYSLNVFDSKGCTLAPYQVTVNVLPAISIQVNSSGSGICPGTTAQITPTISGGDGNYTYKWLPGNSVGSSIYVENISIPVYSLYVNDACGSPTALKEIEIKLHPVTQPVYVSKTKSGCMPLCVEFINTTPLSTNVIWNYGDRPFEQRGDTSYYCYEKAGNFNLRLTVTDSNSCKASFTYSNAITVLVSPDADFVTDPGIITLNDAENVLLNNTTANASSYEWYIDGRYLGESKNIHYTFRDTGCYDIKLLAKNMNQCRDSSTRSICVFEGFNFYMPKAFTPNNDGLNDVLLPKGTGWLYENYKFEVYNRWGFKVFSTTNVSEGWNGGLVADPNVPDVHTADPNNVYAWRVVVTDNMQQTHELRGFAVIVR